MKIANFIIVSLIISFVALLLLRFQSTTKGGKFNLEITIEGLNNDAESFWALGFIDPDEGLGFMNFETGKLSKELYTKLEFEGEKINIEGAVKRPQLCRLIDFKNKLQLVFILGAGKQKITTSIDNLRARRYSFEPAPFKFEGCDLNNELLNFWRSLAGRNFSNAFCEFYNWKKEQLFKLYGISSDEYAIFELIKRRSSLSKMLKVSKKEEANFYKLEAEKLNKLEKIKLKLILGYLEKNPSSYLALEYVIAYAHILRNCQIDYEYMHKYMALIGTELYEEDTYKKLDRIFIQKKRLRISAPAPNFRGIEVNGDKFSLSDLVGNNVLIEFMESQCDFCKREQSNLLDLYVKYQNHDFMILSVSFDKNKEDWIEYLKNNEMPWIQIYDSIGIESATIEKYSTSGFPFYMLINKDGHICSKSFRSLGKDVDDENNLNMQLEKIYKF